MKNKIKLKKASNKVEQPFLTHKKEQTIDSKEIYQATSESKTADSGRSMVEMLGVLAVVGVLSVGGILGYKYAMNKYQANQIVNELNLTSSQMAIMLMRPHTADFELSLGEPYDDGHIATNALAFDFGCGTGADGEDANCATDDIEYFSEVQGVSEEVCKNLVQLVQSLPYLEEVLVNDAADETGALCAENSTVRCLFNADPNALIDDNSDPEEDLCEDGFSGPECDCKEPRVYDKERQLCSCPKTQPHWDAENETCDNNCLTNVDCADPDEYCHTPEGLYDCTTKYGTCEKPTYIKEYKGYVYTIQLSFVAGQNYCNALGKRLMPISQMVADTDENDKCILTPTGSEVLNAFFGSDSPSGVYTLEDDLGLVDSSQAACNGLAMAINFGNGWPSGRILALLPKNMAFSTWRHTIICAP